MTGDDTRRAQIAAPIQLKDGDMERLRRLALRARADEVQREMVRAAAGLDNWDGSWPVVIERWVSVFEELQTALARADAEVGRLTRELEILKVREE